MTALWVVLVMAVIASAGYGIYRSSLWSTLIVMPGDRLEEAERKLNQLKEQGIRANLRTYEPSGSSMGVVQGQGREGRSVQYAIRVHREDLEQAKQVLNELLVKQ